MRKRPRQTAIAAPIFAHDCDPGAERGIRPMRASQVDTQEKGGESPESTRSSQRTWPRADIEIDATIATGLRVEDAMGLRMGSTATPQGGWSFRRRRCVFGVLLRSGRCGASLLPRGPQRREVTSFGWHEQGEAGAPRPCGLAFRHGRNRDEGVPFPWFWSRSPNGDALTARGHCPIARAGWGARPTRIPDQFSKLATARFRSSPSSACPSSRLRRWRRQ
jgi:hypothetical protein